MIWTEAEILRKVRRLHKAGEDLSYNAMAASHQPLLSAAAYHFGSYRRAVELAGFDYAGVLRRPRWTRARIIALIKSARRRGEKLHWSGVTSRRDELGKAAFAALQPRLFGNWHRALHAAGLDADDIARYRHWDRNSIVFELKCRHRDDEPLSSGSLQQDDAGLHAAAIRHFGTYDAALRAASLDPRKFRRRRRWDRKQVLQSIKAVHRDGKSVADSSVRSESPALYGASIRLFGTFTAARRAAGVKFRRTAKRA